jgi:ATP-dependent DNA ligase
MLATLTDIPFNDPNWIFEDKFDGFRMVAEKRNGKVALYSRNGKVISRSYIEVAKALEGVRGDAVIDAELVARGKHGISHFQLLQNALRHEAKLLYCAFEISCSRMEKTCGNYLSLSGRKGSKPFYPATNLSRSVVIGKQTGRSSSPRPIGKAWKAL